MALNIEHHLRTTHVKTLCQVFGNSGHAVGSAIAGVSVTRAEPTTPLVGDAITQPLLHLRGEFITAGSEKLCSMINHGGTNSTSGTSSTTRTPFVQHHHFVAGGSDVTRRSETTEPSTNDHDFHRWSTRLCGRPA